MRDSELLGGEAGAEADREQAFIDAAELADVAAEVEAEIAAYQEIIDIMEGGEENDADKN